jgi:hypothetical protein
MGVRLLDDAYTAWLAAEIECARALAAWFEGTPRNLSTRYFVYLAALDREEAAARDLRRLSELCRDQLGDGPVKS